MLWLIFYISNILGEDEKQKQVQMTQRSTLIGWFFLIETAIGPWLDQGLTGCHVNLNELLQRLMDKNSLFRQRCLNSPEYP